MTTSAAATRASDVRNREPRADALNLDKWIERGKPFACSFELRASHVAGVVEQLALQVRCIDSVVVDEHDSADAGRRQVERRRRAQPAGTYEEDARSLEALLPFQAKLGQPHLTAVSVDFSRVELACW